MRGIQAAALGGSVMILLALLLRLLLKNRLPRRLFPALWCAAALRLLLPFEIPTRLSVWNLLRSAEPLRAGAVKAVVPFPALAQASQAGAAQTADAAVSPRLLVWCVVTALLAAYFAAGYVLMVRRLRGSRLAPEPSVRVLLSRFRFSRSPRICVSRSRRAPLTFGIIRPTVLLPEGLPAGDAQFQLVLAHELAHVRRKDCLRKLLLTVCLCLCWWNPLVWLMVCLADRDMELACDEAVLRALGPDCKKIYAMTLLDMAQRSCGSAPLCSGFARSRVEERIRAILAFRRVSARAGICAAVLFALSAGVLATQARPLAGAGAPAPAQEAERAQTAPEMRVRFLEAEVVPPADASEAPEYVWPLEDADAAVTDGYGLRIHPVTGGESFHSGIDLAAEEGANVLAVADGTVVSCEYSEAYGNLLTIQHADGIQTQYAHLQDFLVQPGDTVLRGEAVAHVGATGWATGPHLHLDVLVDGIQADPLEALKNG